MWSELQGQQWVWQDSHLLFVAVLLVALNDLGWRPWHCGSQR